MAGGTLGTVITWPVAGWLMVNYGWASAFHVPALVTILLTIVWFFVVYNRPGEHPRISRDEQVYIERSLGNTVSNKSVSLGELYSSWTTWQEHFVFFLPQKKFPPFMCLLTSVPVWSLLFLHFGSMWAYYFLMTGAPKYMNEVLHFHLGHAGFFASIPYLVRFISSFLFGAAGDWLLKNEKFEKKTIRKSFCFFCKSNQQPIKLHFNSHEYFFFSLIFSSYFAWIVAARHGLHWQQSICLCCVDYSRPWIQRCLHVYKLTKCTRFGPKLHGQHFFSHQFGGNIVRGDDTNGHCLLYTRKG